MDRRGFLLTLAAGLAVAATGRGAVTGTRAGEGVPVAAPTGLPPSPVAAVEVPARPVAPAEVVTALPGAGNGLALTIDDGTNSEVVAAFATLAVDAGVRLTFFPNGRYRSWAENAAVLRPLAESGQVAFGNHTWSHPDLTRLGDAEIAEEIRRNQQFLRTTLGVVDTPFLRPPFGAHDERTDRIAADLGHPTIAMWNGTLGDSRVLTGAELVGYAREWFTPQTIVVGHANHPTVTTVYGELLDLIRERQLRTVTLADVWAPPSSSFRGAVATGHVGS
ncbi:polysaccharide deacetylase family protein [Blastococcus goldschmidtiae]|uniref:Polysaccharide deacetylase family protein n=1 Tax=Blastococcus goldschmidtiae TaxID=3075546 RepID=A0ABU2K819_9ACTN|nr:polysaccharide deacetylase family protein [Blastococcus sp. DSM 46792]MDT0276339.1 polysaccharide deacetylase family protein [Blastococcus sp. DSM 46792]